MSVLANFALSTGIILLFHAAYSLQHYRSLLHDLEEIDGDGISSTLPLIPLDVRIEVGAALAILLLEEMMRVVLTPVVVKPGVEGKGLGGLPPSYVTRDFDIYKDRARGFAAKKRS